MPLIDNAGAVLKRSWSVRLMGASGTLQGIAYAIPQSDLIPDWIVPALFALSFACTGLAFLARFIAQEGLSLPDGGDDAATAPQ